MCSGVGVEWCGCGVVYVWSGVGVGGVVWLCVKVQDVHVGGDNTITV